MSTMWVADDGSYGTGRIVTVDTANWSETDWEELEEVSDSERIHLACAIERERNGE